jgi:hypothetical protein
VTISIRVGRWGFDLELHRFQRRVGQHVKVSVRGWSWDSRTTETPVEEIV